MVENKMVFITCVNDENLYEKSLSFIRKLQIPEGIEIEIIAIRQSKSMASAYNEAMMKNDCKYKVYIHQDVYIQNTNFIFNILDVFKADAKVGLIGMVGAKIIPVSGIWWEDQGKVGKVYDSHSGTMNLLDFNEIEDLYSEVKGIDGLIMITQYDLPWRDDIFDGWHFYDLSQSVEFMRSGFKVVVPKQGTAWCIHDCGVVNTLNGYEEYRNAFLKEYFKDVFPIVTIMITAYNRPIYFKIALESAINQTYKNIEIVVCDNSTNNECNTVIVPFLEKYKNIRYYKNEHELEVIDNFQKCISLSRGEFISFLMDDDIFHISKIEAMIHYFVEDSKIALVTSYRQVIDGNGNERASLLATQRLFSIPTRLTEKTVRDFILKDKINVLGETTVPLFRRVDILNLKFGVYLERQYKVIADVATWLSLLTKGDMIYLPQTLNYFRIHGGQDQQRIKTILIGSLEWFYLVKDSFEKGFVDSEDELLILLKDWFGKWYFVVDLIRKNNLENTEEAKEIYQAFNYINHIEIKKQKLAVISNNALPLVSILIPAYNRPDLLKIALESALNQTYENIEIIVGDDSTNDEVKNFMQPYLIKYNKVNYFKNEINANDFGLTNLKKLLAKSSGEYINFLFHDDIFHISKIEKMMNYFLTENEISIVTSHRQLIDENGNNINDNGATRRIFNKDTIINGVDFTKLVINILSNVIGEPTTVLFKKNLLDEGLGYYNSNSYINLLDLATWFSLLSKGNAVYIVETLSYFRQHQNQNSQNLDLHVKGILEWKQLIMDSYSTKIINDDEKKVLITKWYNSFKSEMKLLPDN